jgi:hypothetical protein
VRTDQVLRIFIFSKLTQFSNRAVFAYMMIVVLLIGILFLEIDISLNNYLIYLLTKIFINLKK